MDEDKLTATITINPNDFLKPLERTLVDCSNSVFMGLALFENMKELPEFLHGEDNFTLHKPYGVDLSLDQRKILYRDWLIKKGFEDLIKGVTSMLIEISKVLSIKSKLKDQKTWCDFIKLITTPDYEMTIKNFPDLLKLIKPYLIDTLNYETEINSINRVRRCLVHRNGIVSPVDFFKGETMLKLCWIYYKAVYIVDGKEEEVKPYLIISGKGQIKLIQESKEKEFKENERIEVTYQQFNELIMTCSLFGQDLISKLHLQ